MALSRFLCHRGRDIVCFSSEEEVAARDYSSDVAAGIIAALSTCVFQAVGHEMMKPPRIADSSREKRSQLFVGDAQ